VTPSTWRSWALAVAVVHLLGVTATAWYVAQSTDGQAPMVWVYWAVIDFPWSLAYVLFGHGYTGWAEIHSASHPILAQLLYFPHLLHGVVGTVWWYSLVRLIGKLVIRIRGPARSGRVGSASS
jgi:hypothetical protein